MFIRKKITYIWYSNQVKYNLFVQKNHFLLATNYLFRRANKLTPKINHEQLPI